MTDTAAPQNAAAGSPSPDGANASPAPAVVTGAGGAQIPTDPGEALRMRDALVKDRGFQAKFASTDPMVNGAARLTLEKLNQVAFPEPGAAKHAPGSAEAARARIAELRRDPEFVRRYSEGGLDERQELENLHRQAYGTSEADTGGPTETPSGDTTPLPFSFAEGTSEAQQTEMRAIADETIVALKVPRDEAAAVVQVLERDHAARRDDSGNIRPIDETERWELESLLRSRWGAEGSETYERNADRLEAALKSAGRGAGWLRESLRHANPQTVAAAAFFLVDSVGARNR